MSRVRRMRGRDSVSLPLDPARAGLVCRSGSVTGIPSAVAIAAQLRLNAGRALAGPVRINSFCAGVSCFKHVGSANTYVPPLGSDGERHQTGQGC